VNDTERGPGIRRILVALDASSQSLAALETAADLAGRFKADLVGLFVEDIDLLRAAEFPFAAEISMFSTATRRLQLPELEMQLRAQAGQMRKALEALSAREGISGQLRVVRGSVISEILSAEPDADLIVVGKRGWSMSKRLGSTLQMILFRGRGMTLVLHPGVRIALPVVTVYDGSALSQKALGAATQFVQVRDGLLVVMVIAEDEDSAVKMGAAVVDRLRGIGHRAEVRTLIRPSLRRLVHAVQGMGPVVVPCGSGVLRPEGLCEIINVIQNPVLLVR